MDEGFGENMGDEVALKDSTEGQRIEVCFCCFDSIQNVIEQSRRNLTIKVTTKMRRMRCSERGLSG